MQAGNFEKRLKFVGKLVAFGVLATSLLLGQIPSTGTISGHVRAPGGVSAPGATVQLTNPQTGERKETWTDESGDYAFSGLAPGNYRLDVSLVGFRSDSREPIPVTSDKTLKVNVALVFGVHEGETPQSARANARPAGNIATLPAGRRNGAPNPDAVETPVAESGGPGEGATVRMAEGAGVETQAPAESSIEGPDTSVSASNSFLLGGGVGDVASPDGEFGGRGGRRGGGGRGPGGGGFGPGGGGFGGGPGGGGPPGPGGFGGGGGGGFGGGGGGFGGGGGGFGGGGGGASGWARNRARVNRIRGNLMENYTNSGFDAHPYPLNVASLPRIPSFAETVGFTLGGPLVIPHVYNGANKTTWFVNYHLGRTKSGTNSFSTVPTAAERQGDFSSTVITAGPYAGTVPTLYDPQSGPPGSRTAFPDNVILPGRINSAALGLLNYIPLPNLPGTVQNYRLQASLPSASDSVMVRIGEQINSKNSLNVMYGFNSGRSQSIGSFPQFTSHVSTRGQNVSLNASHTFNPHLVNTLSLNFTRQRSSSLNAFAYQDDIAATLGIEGVSTNPFDWGVPAIGFTNFGGLSDPLPSLTRNQTVRATEILIWNHGKHNVRLGGDLRRVQQNSMVDPNARGTFSFTGYSTSNFSGSFPVPGTGFDFADFLLGLPQTTSVRFGVASNYVRSWVTTSFIQDDWRVGAHLTVNAGLRYELFFPATEKYGHLSDLSFAPGFASPQVVTGLNPGSLPPSLVFADNHLLSPRLGLAYRPWTRHHLVLRGGYGIFYDGSIYSRLVPNMLDQPPFAQASTLTTNATQVLTLETGFPALGASVIHNTYAADSNFRTPYAQSWNVSAEQELVRNVILSVGYVGTRGNKLDLLLAPNSVSPSVSGSQSSISNALQFLYETSGASSIYNGLQVSLRRQFHGGFSMSGNYTFGKSIDDAASVGGSGRNVPQDSFDLRAERAISSFNVADRLIINHTYEFPFGEQRHFLNRGGVPARIIGNWQISGITSLQTGAPFTAQVAGNQSNNNGSGVFASQRADATGVAISLPPAERTTTDFFNTAAFTLPASGQLGTAGRDTITGPGIVNFNMSLARFFTFPREKNLRAQFHIDASNIFNHPNWGGVASTVNSQNFGWVTSVRSMRAVTLSLRVNF